jgi:hypothetical protein
VSDDAQILHNMETKRQGTLVERERGVLAIATECDIARGVAITTLDCQTVEPKITPRHTPSKVVRLLSA